MASLRALGPFERYFLTRTNLGFPPVLVFVAFLDAPVDPRALVSSVDALLARYPLLSCCIPEPTKPFPRWKTNAAVNGSTIVEVLHTSPPELTDLLSNPATIELSTGPLWRIRLYLTDTPKLVLHIHHIVSDGIGSRNLLVELLQLLADKSTARDVTPTPFPPTLEQTVDVRPYLLVLLYNIYVAVILPNLPALLRTWVTPTAVWPNPPRVPPLGTGCVAVIRVPPDAVRALNEAGKKHGVRTFHPLLTTLALHATWVMAGRGDEVVSSHNTPASERDATRGHPTATGNFVASFSNRVILTPRRLFWPLARELATKLASPAGRARARSNMGMLGYIPKPNVLNARGQTGWEETLERSIIDVVDFAQTFGISNLGLVPRCPGVKELVWAQQAFPGTGSEAFCLEVITITDGPMYVTVNWREGVVNDAEVDAFKADFEELVAKIALGGIADDATFKDLPVKCN